MIFGLHRAVRLGYLNENSRFLRGGRELPIGGFGGLDARGKRIRFAAADRHGRYSGKRFAKVVTVKTCHITGPAITLGIRLALFILIIGTTQRLSERPIRFGLPFLKPQGVYRAVCGLPVIGKIVLRRADTGQGKPHGIHRAPLPAENRLKTAVLEKIFRIHSRAALLQNDGWV